MRLARPPSSSFDDRFCRDRQGAKNGSAWRGRRNSLKPSTQPILLRLGNRGFLQPCDHNFRFRISDVGLCATRRARLEPASPHELSNCDRPIERARYIQLPETREQAPMAWAHALMFRQHAFLTLKKSPSVSNFAPACVFRRNLSPGAISSNQYSDGSEFVPLICRGGVQQENSPGCLGY